MDGDWLTDDEWEPTAWEIDFDEVSSVQQILDEERFRIHYVDGVAISGKDYPPCLDSAVFDSGVLDCDQCEFFIDEECKLRRSATYRLAVWEIIEPWVEREKKRQERLERREALRAVLAEQLEAHGRELHYSVIARMVQQRYPHLEATESLVLRILSSSPELFEQLGPGLYKRCDSDTVS